MKQRQMFKELFCGACEHNQFVLWIDQQGNGAPFTELRAECADCGSVSSISLTSALRISDESVMVVFPESGRRDDGGLKVGER